MLEHSCMVVIQVAGCRAQEINHLALLPHTGVRGMMCFLKPCMLSFSCVQLCDPMDSMVHYSWGSPGMDTGVGCCAIVVNKSTQEN